MLSEARILLVGDDGLAREETEGELTRSGFNVATVDNLVEGLAVLEEAKLSEKPFQLAVLGLRHSIVEDGFIGEHTEAQLRQLFEISPWLPVILIDPKPVLKTQKSTNNHRKNETYLEGNNGSSLVKLIRDILGSNAE